MTKSLLIMTACFLLGSTFTQAQKKSDSPVILTVEGETITRAEFEAVYNKNNNVSQNIEQKSPSEYMELFVNYKLKVKEAEAVGLDTVPKYQRELQGYLDQLAAPYLVDNAFEEGLIKEAYDRLQQDVHASHILVKVSADASPSDTLDAYDRIKSLLASAQAGEDFGELALASSDDPSAKQNKGDLGYFSALRMVYPFESAAYNTAIGEVSNPVRTSFGYHIIKVHGKRDAVGQVRAAHVMVSVKPDASEEIQSQAQEKIQEIYNRAISGEDFGMLARMYSDDRGSKARGGELPWFGSGRMVAPFENAAFALENDGDVSQPIQTQYGWHVIKRLEKKGMNSYEEEYENLKKRVERDGRAKGSKEALAKQLESTYKIKTIDDNVADVLMALDSTYFSGSFKFSSSVMSGFSKPLLTWKDKAYTGDKITYTQKDFAVYLEGKSKRQKPMSLEILVAQAFDEFKTSTILDFEREILPIKYPAYKALVQEYRDGILLFELMDQKVWQAAVKDTAGLEAYYAENKSNFMWTKRLQASVYTCNSQKNLDAVAQLLKEQNADSAIIAKVNAENPLAVDIRSGKFTAKDLPVLEQVEWKKGTYLINENGFYLIQVDEVIPAMPKEIDEARGIITSSYQTYLEATWLEELRSKYTFSINEEVLKGVKSL